MKETRNGQTVRCQINLLTSINSQSVSEEGKREEALPKWSANSYVSTHHEHSLRAADSLLPCSIKWGRFLRKT